MICSKDFEPTLPTKDAIPVECAGLRHAEAPCHTALFSSRFAQRTSELQFMRDIAGPLFLWIYTPSNSSSCMGRGCMLAATAASRVRARHACRHGLFNMHAECHATTRVSPGSEPLRPIGVPAQVIVDSDAILEKTEFGWKTIDGVCSETSRSKEPWKNPGLTFQRI